MSLLPLTSPPLNKVTALVLESYQHCVGCGNLDTLSVVAGGFSSHALC